MERPADRLLQEAWKLPRGNTLETKKGVRTGHESFEEGEGPVEEDRKIR
jgi:hypothetical protein